MSRVAGVMMMIVINIINKNSSADDIANVNFYAVGRKLPEFAEITQNNAITPFKVIQGHSWSPILVPIESSYTIFY